MINKLTELLEEKVASFAASVIMGAIAESPLGFALEASARLSEFVESDGISELDKIATHEIRELTRPLRFKIKGKGLLRKVGDLFSEPARDSKVPWRRSNWATSKQDWIANKWKHDWRSQPRIPAGSAQIISTRRGDIHAGGEWTFGRLSSPVEGAPAIGKGKQRSSRKSRMLRRYRRYGRLAARDFAKGL